MEVRGANFGKSCIRASQLRGIKNYVEAHWIGTDIRDIDFSGAYLVRRHIVDENYLDEFRNQGRNARAIYWVWKTSSDCGRSLLRWVALQALIVIAFAIVLGNLPPKITPLSPSEHLASAGFSIPVTGGYFLINGEKISVNPDKDTLQDVFDRVGAATRGVVKGYYIPAEDRVGFASATGALDFTDGSPGSNFIVACKLSNGEHSAVSRDRVGVEQSALFIPPDTVVSAYTPFYFSLVVVTTLGFGDVLPKTVPAQVIVNLLTLVGYVGLGGLMTILGNQLGRRGE